MENTNKGFDKTDYVLTDNNGFIIEKSEKFNEKIVPFLNNIIHKGKAILEEDGNNFAIDLFFDNATCVLKSNTSTNLNISMIVNNK
jgi:hypothetical protein